MCNLRSIFVLLLVVFLVIESPVLNAQINSKKRNFPQIIEQLEIDSVWAANRVSFALNTVGDHQFVAYYNKNRMMTIASRSINSKTWTKKVLPIQLRWDSHNYVAMGVDEQGYLHISGNMHVNPLVYYRSSRPYDVSSITEVNSMLGQEEEKVTYPKFFNGKDGRLYYSYRNGTSGNGSILINRFDTKAGVWERYLSTPLFDGMSNDEKRSAYHSFTRDIDGNFHYIWLWRHTPKVETSHQLCYATSTDLINWKNAAGEAVFPPFKPDNQKLIVDNVPSEGGLHNGRIKVVTTPDKQPFLGYVKYDEQGNTQLYIAGFKAGKWLSKSISNWDFRWKFFGGGDQMTEGGNFDIAGFSDDGFLVINWETEKGESGTYVVNPITLVLVKNSQVNIKQKYSPAIHNKLTNNPEMSVILAKDNGQSEELGVNYVLKWETMPKSHGAHAPTTIPSTPVSPLFLIKNKVSQ